MLSRRREEKTGSGLANPGRENQRKNWRATGGKTLRVINGEEKALPSQSEKKSVNKIERENWRLLMEHTIPTKS